MSRAMHLLVLIVFCNPASFAATITVDSLADETQPNGACSLREAVIAANSNNAGDCVAGSSGIDEIVFVELLTGTMTFVDSTPLSVTESLTITGPGAQSLIIDAAMRARVFHVNQPQGSQFAISDLTIRAGQTAGDGGGILIDGGTTTVDISGVTFELNAAGNAGGALAMRPSSQLSLHVSGSEFKDNDAVISGGAIYQADAASSASVEAVITQTRFFRNTNPRSEASVVLSCDLAPCLIDLNTNEFVNHRGHAASLTMSAQSNPGSLYFRNNVVRKNVSDAGGRGNDPGGPVISAGLAEALIFNNVFHLYEAELGGALTLSANDPNHRIIVGFNSLWSGDCWDVDDQSCASAVYVSNATAVLYGNYFDEEFDAATCRSSLDGSGTIESAGYNVARFADNSCIDLTAPNTTDSVTTGTTRPGAGGSMSFFDSFRGPTARTSEIADRIPGPCTIPSPYPGMPGIPVSSDYTGQIRPVDHDNIAGARCDAGATELSPLLLTEQLGSGEGTLNSNGNNGFGAIFTWDTKLNRPDGGIYSEVLGGELRISARPDPGNLFLGFSDGCDAVVENNGFTICEIVSDRAQLISATFESIGAVYELSASVSGNGSGTIISAPDGISCAPDCASYFEADSVVALTFETTNGSSFLRWEGACTGSGVCQVTMNDNKAVAAVFVNPDIFFYEGFENNSN